MRLPHPWLLLVAADAAWTRDAWRASCGVDDATPLPAAPAKRSVAVLIWGESFRDSRKRGERRRCGDGSLRAQNVVRDMHFRLFDALARMGYESRVFGVTASCDGARPPLDAAAVLARWYAPRLGAPVLALDPEAPALNAALRARYLSLLLLRGFAAPGDHGHVLQLRWDLQAVASEFKPCFLASGALLDSHVFGFGPEGDWDRVARGVFGVLMSFDRDPPPGRARAVSLRGRVDVPPRRGPAAPRAQRDLRARRRDGRRRAARRRRGADVRLRPGLRGAARGRRVLAPRLPLGRVPLGLPAGRARVAAGVRRRGRGRQRHGLRRQAPPRRPRAAALARRRRRRAPRLAPAAPRGVVRGGAAVRARRARARVRGRRRGRGAGRRGARRAVRLRRGSTG